MKNCTINKLNILVLSYNQIIIGRADAEDKWLKETYPEKDDDDDNDYETLEPVEHHCSENEFECISDHKCIPSEKQCDYKNDCDDGSDESVCGTTVSDVVPDADVNTESNDVDGSGTEGDGFTGWVVFISHPKINKWAWLLLLLITFFARKSPS